MRGTSKRIRDIDYGKGEIRDHLIVRDRQITHDERGAAGVGAISHACDRIVSVGSAVGTTLKDIFRLSA